jgi:hypothetical protein
MVNSILTSKIQITENIMIAILGILLFSLIFILGTSYSLTSGMMEHEIAQRITLHLFAMFLLFDPIAFLFSLMGKYGLVSHQIIFPVVFIFDSLNLYFKKRKSEILLDIGKYEQWAATLTAGLILLGLSISKALSFSRYVSPIQIKRMGIQKYVGRVKESGSTEPRHSHFYVGIYGRTWVQFMTSCTETVSELLQLSSK